MMRNNAWEGDEHDSGNFSSGLVLGLFAGMAGMFLFGTKKGKKTLDRLKVKWEEYSPTIQDGLESTEASLKKSKRPFFQALGEIVDYVAEHLQAETKGKTKSTKAISTSKSHKKTFFSKQRE